MLSNIWRKEPRVIIKYGKLLDPIFTFYCKNNQDLKAQGWNDWMPPPQEVIMKKIEDYRNEWSKYGDKILRGMCEITGLRFKRNIIDVYIVSGNPRQLSDPIIVRADFIPHAFINVLAHELIHKLFADNGDVFPSRILDEMFPGEGTTVKNHVITHAVLKYIYLDVLKEPARLEQNIEASDRHGTDEYSRAWQIVEERGYKNLIRDWRTKVKGGLPLFR